MTLSNKDMKSLAKEAKAQGWEITTKKSNHLRWVSPSGAVVTTSLSPSDGNAIKQIRRDLVAKGFITVHKKDRRKR
jgi:predicted RNA binding protein YcfA (HicA-like mRNA interferase family)